MSGWATDRVHSDFHRQDHSRGRVLESSHSGLRFPLSRPFACLTRLWFEVVVDQVNIQLADVLCDRLPQFQLTVEERSALEWNRYLSGLRRLGVSRVAEALVFLLQAGLKLNQKEGNGQKKPR